MVWYLLFFIVPIVFIVVYSFASKDITKRLPVDFGHLGLQNYRTAFGATFFKTFKQTIKIAVIATALCIFIGLPVAYFLAYKVREKWRATLLALVVIPSFTSFLIRTLAWRIPLAPNGYLSKWLQEWGVIHTPIHILETATAVQLAIVYNYLGFVILPLFVALDRIDIRMLEASKDLGAGRFSTFSGVTLPLAGPGIAAAVLLTYIPMCGDYVTATILGGAKGNMIGAMVASQFTSAQNWPLGSAMAVMMILAVLLTLGLGVALVYLARWITKVTAPMVLSFRRGLHERRMASVTANADRQPSRTIDWVKPLFGLWTLLVLLFMFIPIFLVILHSFNRGASFSIWSGHVSTTWWGKLFDAPKAMQMVLTFAGIVLLGVLGPKIVRWTTGKHNRHVDRWAGPLSFVVAFVYCGFSTEWYRTIFLNAGVGDAMRNSFLAAFGATIISVILGAFAGTALARRPGTWTAVFMAVVFLILVTPEIMDAIALATWFPRWSDIWGLRSIPVLRGLFSEDFGPFRFGINKLWVGQSLYASAVVTLIVRARLAGLDESLEEAAGDLGAPPPRAFRQITLPLISSALVAGALLSFTLCLDNTVISALNSDAGSSTFPVALLGSAKSSIRPFWGVGAVVLFMITMAALAFVGSVLKKSGDSSSQIAATLAGG
jgi:spermidine/putrescine transport system permease protein